ncbi:MAG: hypothetical protein JWO68_2521 [Actinomycetia bacterium]|nr:hypothetical protein [Actinomycetes bacterium]
MLAGLIGLPAIVLPAFPAQATDPVLHGTLLDAEHEPVTSDGVVRAFNQGNHLVVGEVAVGTDGAWALDVAPGNYELQGAVIGSGDPDVSQVDFSSVLVGGEEGGPVSHELVVEAPTVSGHVLDSHLDGIDGAAVALSDGENFYYPHSWGADGYWAVDAVSGDYYAWSWAAGHVPTPGVPTTAPTTTAEIVLPAPTVTGTLLAPVGSTPAGHVSIVVEDLDQGYAGIGVTDIDGSFEFDLPDGSYRLWPETDRLSTTEAAARSEVVVVEGGAVVSVGGLPAAELDFRLASPNVMVEVLTPELDPSPAGAVVGMDDTEVRAPLHARDLALLGNTFGLFLEDGDWPLTVQPPANDQGWELAQVTVTVRGGEVTAVNGVPASSVSIHYVVPNVRGRVLDRLGQPAPGVRVATMDDRWSATTDVDGHFDIALPDGARQLTTLEPLGMNLGVVTVDVVVGDGELVSPTSLELALPSPNMVITVTDATTHLPVVGAYSELRPYGWSYHADTDADGHLDFVSSDGDWALVVEQAAAATLVTWRVVGGVITDVVNTGPLEVMFTPVVA